MTGRVLRDLPGKRNRVRLLEGAEGLFVEKTFPSALAAEREAGVYRMLSGSGLRAPALLEQRGARLTLSFLGGEDYLSLLELQERTGVRLAPWLALLDWLRAFQRATGLTQQDVNLRNFLWLGSAAAGLDFEDCSGGSLAESLARLAAYVLHYEPPGTDAKQAIAACIEARAVEWRLCSREAFIMLLRKEEALLCERRKRREP